MILGIIPSRCGSKGIKNKNIYPINGKRLIDYTIKPALDSILDDVVITTDDSRMLSNIFHTKYIIRPVTLADDDTPMIDVIQHAILKYETIYRKIVDTVCLLQPTSPLRTTGDINNAINMYLTTKSKSLYSGYLMGIKHKEKPYDKHTQEPHFQRNGAIFISSVDLIAKGKIWDNNAIQFQMLKSRSIDIDDADDMYIAESLLLRGSEL